MAPADPMGGYNPYGEQSGEDETTSNSFKTTRAALSRIDPALSQLEAHDCSQIVRQLRTDMHSPFAEATPTTAPKATQGQERN
jgi:hypothetical protein